MSAGAAWTWITSLRSLGTLHIKSSINFSRHSEKKCGKTRGRLRHAIFELESIRRSNIATILNCRLNFFVRGFNFVFVRRLFVSRGDGRLVNEEVERCGSGGLQTAGGGIDTVLWGARHALTAGARVSGKLWKLGGFFIIYGDENILWCFFIVCGYFVVIVLSV